MILYIFYLVLFITIVLLQMKIGESYEVQNVSEAIKNSVSYSNTKSMRIFNATGFWLTPLPFTFDDISNTPEIVDWITDLTSKYIYTPTKIIQNQNYIFGDPTVRLSIRLVKVHDNKNSKSKDAILTRISNKNYEFHDSLGDEENTETIHLLKTGQFVEYTEPGGRDSSLEKGGFIFEFGTDGDKLNETLAELYADKTISTSWAFIVLEFMYFSRNAGAIVENDIIFMRSSAGITDQSYSSYTVWSYYNSPLDYFRGFLEAIFMLIYLGFMLRVLNGFRQKFRKSAKSFLDLQNEQMKKNNI
jgi:hypothetical protein